jgi:hypothetical protein
MTGGEQKWKAHLQNRLQAFQQSDTLRIFLSGMPLKSQSPRQAGTDSPPIAYSYRHNRAFNEAVISGYLPGPKKGKRLHTSNCRAWNLSNIKSRPLSESVPISLCNWDHQSCRAPLCASLWRFFGSGHIIRKWQIKGCNGLRTV